MKTGTLLLSLLLASVAFAGKSAEEELLALESLWGQYLVKADAAALEKLFADEYLFTDETGKPFTKEQDIDATRSGTFKMSSFRFEDLKAHVYGDFGVVTGVNTIKASYQGEDASGKFRFTDVFVKRDGRWQCVASHVTKVVGP